MRVNRLKLISAMVLQNLTLLKLAELSGVSKATLSAVKNGKSCSFRTASKIAKVLDLDVMELIESEV